MQLLIDTPGVDHNSVDKENTPLLCRMLNADHPRLTCFARLLSSGYLTPKTLSQSKKWLQRKLKGTSEPSSFILITNALFCLTSLETVGGTPAWCSFCFEVKKEGKGLLACSRCKCVG